MRLVLIEWLDAFSIDEWTKIKRLILAPDCGKSLCSTVGWLAYDGDDFKTVVSSTGHNDGSGSMIIPSCSIKRIRDLRVEHSEVAPESER